MGVPYLQFAFGVFLFKCSVGATLENNTEISETFPNSTKSIWNQMEDLEDWAIDNNIENENKPKNGATLYSTFAGLEECVQTCLEPHLDKNSWGKWGKMLYKALRPHLSLLQPRSLQLEKKRDNSKQGYSPSDSWTTQIHRFLQSLVKIRGQTVGDFYREYRVYTPSTMSSLPL